MRDVKLTDILAIIAWDLARRISDQFNMSSRGMVKDSDIPPPIVHEQRLDRILLP
jgi:hypothetical protein